ncbi:hypothetical protein LTR53_016037 [Teratosphaeriaceae sp. CCFEE 6253]|nr:hypothetical protein LTR53_016037 [Teratosphaeriaceae sp. CCFEE 6253]
MALTTHAAPETSEMKLRKLIARAVSVSGVRDEEQRKLLFTAAQQYMLESLSFQGSGTHYQQKVFAKVLEHVAHFSLALDQETRTGLARLAMKSMVLDTFCVSPAELHGVLAEIPISGRSVALEAAARTRLAQAAETFLVGNTTPLSLASLISARATPPLSNSWNFLRSYAIVSTSCACLRVGNAMQSLPGADAVRRASATFMHRQSPEFVARPGRRPSQSSTSATSSTTNHARRVGFDRLFAHCESIRAWAVRNIGSVNVRPSDMIIDDVDVVVRCGEGLWDLFRWHATGETRSQIFCDGHVPLQIVAIIRGAVERAVDCRAEGVTDENELRLAFDSWLQMLDLTCRCKASEWHESDGDNDVWYACSRHVPARVECFWEGD